MANGPVSRRSAMLHLAGAAAALGQQDLLLPTLRETHPRLIWLPEDVARTRDLLKDTPLARKCVADLERDAERILASAPLEYKLAGPRQINQSRRVLDRVYTLSFLYRLDGKRQYLDRAVKELRGSAGFKDWNPLHFLDTAEMTHAFAIGYDWLYADLTPGDRELFRTAIVNKGLEPGLRAYGNPSSWAANRYNWNLVCNSGLTLGALAVADTEGPLADTVIKNAIESVPKALSNYGGDGGWIEGPGYWQYGTHYAVIMFAALESALGRDFGLANQPGFGKAGRFRIYSANTANRVFNYADAAEDLTEEPSMFWLAKRFTQPVDTWRQARLLEHSKQSDPLNLVWFQKDGKPPQGPQWPLDAVFSSVQCAFFRSSWEDSNALFLAVKGGDNKAPHGHLDLGSFVLDAGGVRWATDLGPENNDLSGNSGRQRWQYYRMRTESHNTPLIDGENQDSRAEARITRREFGADASWVQIDLTHAYPARVKNLQRRIGLLNRQAVLIEDTIQAEQPVEMLWGMMTDAEITLNGNMAVLTKNGWTLEAEIQTPRHAVFDVVSAKAPLPQAQNAGYRKLVVRLGEKVTGLELSVMLTPHKTGTPRPKITGKFA